MLQLLKFVEYSAPGFEGPVPGHLIETASSKGGLAVRRIIFDEENDATGHNAMTLLKRKVTAQVAANRS